MWSVATMAEVYGLNALFWGALLWAALRLRRRGSARELYVLALVAGLSLANHATIVLFFPALVFIGWPGKERAKALGRALPLAAALCLVGISVNLYTPLRAAQRPVFNWNDPSTARSLYAHLGGLQYGGHFLVYGGKGVKDAWAQYREAALANVTPLAVFAAVGLAWLFIRRRWAVAAALLAYYVGYLAYCLVYSIPDINYYFIPLHLAVVFAAALGVAWAGGAWARGTAVRRAVAAVAAAAVLGSAAWAFNANYPYGHRRGFTFAETYGRRILAALPARALFFASGDTNAFITRYDVYARRLRPDVTVVVQLMLTNRGYLSALARRDPYAALPAEAEVAALVEYAMNTGAVSETRPVASSEDFVIRAVVERIIAGNAGRRPMFWGIGDPGGEMRKYIVPYGVILEVTTTPPPPAELARRGEAGVAALTDLAALVARRAPAELKDPALRATLKLYYVGLSHHLLDWGILGPQEKLFKSYVRLVPDDEEGYENLAGIYMLTGRPAEAVEYYRRALEIAPGKIVVRARLARALLDVGRVDEAAATAELLEGSKGAPPGEVHYVRGLIYRRRGQIDKALAAFAAAEPDYADDAEFWYERGAAYAVAGDHRAAVDAFGKALAFGPPFAAVYTARGLNYLELGDRERARADLEAAVQLNAGDAAAHYGLACIYAEEDDKGAALEHLKAAVALEPARYAPMAREASCFAGLRGFSRFEKLIGAHAGAPEE